MTADQIRTAALKLDPVEREALAEELLLSIAEGDRKRSTAPGSPRDSADTGHFAPISHRRSLSTM
jgi:hypothetical protein